MITVSQIKEFLASITDVLPVGRYFSASGFEFEFVGFYKENSKNCALFLMFNEELCEMIEEYELSNASIDRSLTSTLREKERQHIHFDIDIPKIKEISFGQQICRIKTSRHTQLSNDEGRHALLIAEFIRKGWESKRFADTCPANIILFTCSPYGAFPVNANENIALSFAPMHKTHLAEIPVTLKVSEDNGEFILPDGQKVYIRNVQTFDIHKHTREVFESEKIRNAFSPEELEAQLKRTEESNKELCPVGKVFLAVEYEAPENTTIRIILKAELDSEIRCRNGAFGIIMSPSTQPDHDGYKIRTETISLPLDPDIKSLEAEIFSFTVSTQPENITL